MTTEKYATFQVLLAIIHRHFVNRLFTSFLYAGLEQIRLFNNGSTFNLAFSLK